VSKILNLELQHTHTSHILTAIRADGTRIILPGLRLVTFANFLRVLKPALGAGQFAICPCIVDTGSYLSVISEELWNRFIPGFAKPLTFAASMHPMLKTLTIAGGTYPYTLGELSIQLEDRKGTLMNVTIIAKLTQDGGRFPIPLTLGLRGGFLDGRRLLAEPDPSARFGQKWTLEVP
jgi:hypothetical protein